MVRLSITTVLGLLLTGALPAADNQSARDLMQEATQRLATFSDQARPEAERLIREALSIWERDSTKNREPHADASVILALVLIGEQKYKEAAPFAEQAIRTYEQIAPGVKNSRLALALEAFWLSSRLTGDSERGQAAQQRAATIRTRVIAEKQLADEAGKPPIGDSVRKSDKTLSEHPKPIFKPEPEYAYPARIAKWQGSVSFSFVIDSEGVPRDIKLVRSLGFGLDEMAYKALKSWRFKPGRYDGTPVPVHVYVDINYKLL